MGIFSSIKLWWRAIGYQLPQRNLGDLKQITKILFIDDRKFEVASILKTSGWTNTSQINDADNIDGSPISDSHIIFVDISGVGKKLKFKDEGLGLISALRKKYPNKKLIVYSAERTGDRFHEGLSDADERLAKNADPFQFQSIVEEFSRESFTLDQCVDRIKDLLIREFGVTMSDKQIIDNIRKIAASGSHDISFVSSVFNLSNAGSIASIVSLFLSPA